MAFSFNPQLLIHEGEINEILGIIKAAKDSQVKIVGALFGLWRNSLKQPVVHLTNGPGAAARISKDAFSPDFDYLDRCKSYLKENHGILQIGFWCSGSISRYPKLDPRSRDFNINSRFMYDKGKYVVLLFVNTQPRLSMDFYIINRNHPHSFASSRLRSEDILPGTSCFRLLPSISKTINDGAKFSSSKPKDQKCYFSRSELSSQFVEVLPSPGEQWYESEFGSSLLGKLLHAFKRNYVSVEMSRHPKSRDMTFELNGKLCLNFPREYPDKGASLSLGNDAAGHRFRNQDEISERLVERAIRVLRVF